MVDALVLYGDEGRSKRTIRFGEPANGFDPDISEWGNPIKVILNNTSFNAVSTPGDVKPLSTPRKRK